MSSIKNTTDISCRLLKVFFVSRVSRARAYPDIAIIAESHTAEHLTRRLIDGTMDVAVMLEPAQLDTLQIREACMLEFICVSSHPGLTIDEVLAGDFIYIDWGLSHGLDHRRAFPDAPEARTRVSHARIALEYIKALGGSGYLPRRMVAEQLDSGALHEVADAPVFRRTAHAVYPVRSPRTELVESTMDLLGGLNGNRAIAVLQRETSHATSVINSPFPVAESC